MRTMTRNRFATLAVMALVLTGCAGQSVSTTPDPSVPAVVSTEVASEDVVTEDPASPTEDAPPATARLGQSITLKGGADTDVDLTVTLLKVVQSGRSTMPDVDAPKSGERWFGTQFRIRNNSATPYSDSPQNGAVVGDAEGQRFNSYMADTTVGVSMPSSVALAPGDSVKGWIYYAVPKGASITLVQWGASSGFGSVAQWNLK